MANIIKIYKVSVGIVLGVLSLPGYAAPLAVDSALHSFKVQEIEKRLVNPWSVAPLPDGSLLISERRGRLHHYSQGEWRQISGLPDIVAVGQGGFMDIEPHPNFTQNNTIFFSFSRNTEGGSHTAVARAQLAADRLYGVRIIFRAQPAFNSKLHFGSRISFLPDSTLLITLGDRGIRDEAQNLQSHWGSVVRINQDGSIPGDNPFEGSEDNALGAIYTYGHRNPQGLVVDSTGGIYLHEHGPRGGDEINRIIPGNNYGWPIVTFGKEYSTNAPIGIGTSAPGYEPPLLHWSPSIAPSGMMIYSGNKFPKWQGHFFIGALAGRHIVRVVIQDNKVIDQEKLLTSAVGRIRDIKEDKDGTIWFITDSTRGSLYSIRP